MAFSAWGWTEKRSGGKGISLNLESLQVIDLVPYEKVDVTSAFAGEDGYVVETPAAQTPFTAEGLGKPVTPVSMAEKLCARVQQVAAEAPAVLARASAEELPF